MAVGHEAVERHHGGAHDFLEIVAVVDGYGVARKRHECVAGQDSAPGIAREHIFVVAALQIELLGRVLQAVEEAGARRARGYFVFIHLMERARADLAQAGREDN